MTTNSTSANEVSKEQQAPELYDLSTLEFLDDNAYLLEVLQMFFTDSARDINELKQALAAGDMSLVGKKAHKLKGSAGVIQAYGLMRLLEQIEKGAIEKKPHDTLFNIVIDMQEHYNLVEENLKKYIETIS